MPNNKTLEQILADLIRLSKDMDGIDVHTKLKGGLHIWVRYYVGKKTFRLSIGRNGVEPSMQEWNVTLSRWPWRVIANPTMSQDERENFFLSAHIPDREG